MINGAHVILFSEDADADRTFLKDVLGFDHVDAGGGWLIFALPPAEAAVHPAESPSQELYLMCDDLQEEMETLRAKGVELEEVEEARWGTITRMTLPGRGKLALYEPKHPRPARP